MKNTNNSGLPTRFTGVKGLWQVSGKNRLKLTQLERLELHDARAMNLWLDLKLITMSMLALIIQNWISPSQPRGHRHSPKPAWQT